MGKVYEELVKVSERGAITIPSGIRKAVGLAGNDMVLVAASEDGNSILIKPQVAIDKSQAWFWTEGWQSEEKKSAEDFEAGRVTRTTAREFLEEVDNW